MVYFVGKIDALKIAAALSKTSRGEFPGKMEAAAEPRGKMHKMNTDVNVSRGSGEKTSNMIRRRNRVIRARALSPLRIGMIVGRSLRVQITGSKRRV